MPLNIGRHAVVLLLVVLACTLLQCSSLFSVCASLLIDLLRALMLISTTYLQTRKTGCQQTFNANQAYFWDCEFDKYFHAVTSARTILFPYAKTLFRLFFLSK